uniref:Uncharacterized protein n=1 Tax=Sonderella linearis TaxID=110477 RepID=A0A1Z1MMB0_9FLOR|nr:hypothetical protein [Sonderella linearis]ARW67002.1 hypothetical protein [Sonderella linearis]
MILFNFIFLDKFFDNYYKNNYHYIFKLSQTQEKYRGIFNLANYRYNYSTMMIVSSKNNTSNNALQLQEHNNLITRNFLQKFINDYLQETIFISKLNNLSEVYINKLKSNGLSVYNGNDYKNFLLKFSKALLHGNIQVNINNIDSNNSFIYKSNNYIKYRWFKLFSLKKFLFCFNNNFISNKLKIYNKNINYKSLPLFALINNSNQIIMSESADKFYLNSIIYKLKNKLFYILNIKSLNNQKNYTGLLFIDPEDAIEYEEYIQAKYIQSTRTSHIHSVTSNINLYLKLLSSSNNNSDFRLMPDLKEISDLVHKYQYNKNILFDANQKYGHKYFQGQPIYLIQPTLVLNKNNNQKKELKYIYPLKKGIMKNNYHLIFLNYKTAINAWEKFRQEYSYYNLPLQPSLLVSNLELFLTQSYFNNNTDYTIFVPSYNTYKFIKKSIKLNKKNNIKKIIINQSLYLKTIVYRLFWSLTTRQPINW